MDTVYSKNEVCEELVETKASTRACFYGVKGKLDFLFYILKSGEMNPYLAVRMKFIEDPNPHTSHVIGIHNGEIKFMHGEGRDRRYITQKIEVKPLIAEILSFTDLVDAGVEQARELVASLLRNYESFLQEIRNNIYESFSLSVRQEAAAWARYYYDSHTTKIAENLLGSFNWPLLLDGTECSQEFLNVIETTTKINPPRYGHVGDELREDIKKALSNVEVNGNIQLAINNARNAALKIKEDKERIKSRGRALSLLRSVCGHRIARDFNNSQEIIVSKNGYQFVIKEGGFVKCKDPNGKKAQLCIHTRGFACHPIDEMIIAYLNINNRFEEYMDKAIVHGAECGFSKNLREEELV